MTTPTGSPNDPVSVTQTDRGTATNPLVVVEQAASTPKGTVADPVVVQQAPDIPKGTVADPIVTSANLDKRLLLYQATLAAVVTISVAYFQSKTDTKVDRIEKTGNQTHALVNSKYGTILRSLAITLRETANRTGKPEDIKAAEEAEQEYKDHRDGQRRADEGKDTGR